MDDNGNLLVPPMLVRTATLGDQTWLAGNPRRKYGGFSGEPCFIARGWPSWFIYAYEQPFQKVVENRLTP